MTLIIFAVMGLVGVVTIMSVPEDAEARGCHTRLTRRTCKLVCGNCGYSLDCGDM